MLRLLLQKSFLVEDKSLREGQRNVEFFDGHAGLWRISHEELHNQPLIEWAAEEESTRHGLFYCTSLACERSSGVLKGEKAVFLDQILIVSRFCTIDITNGYPFKIQPLQLNNPSFISPFADVKFSSIVETLEKSDDPMGALSIEQRSSIAHVTL